MKRLVAVGIAGAALAAGAILLFTRPVQQNGLEGPPAPGEPAPGVRMPGAPALAPEAPAPEPPLPPREPAPPLRVRFEAPEPPKLGQPVAVTIVVEPEPEGWPADLAGEAQLSILLRLPMGIQVESEAWGPVTLDEAEGTGPWRLFETRRKISLRAGAPAAVLAREKVPLAVVEEGVNWVITVRVRMTSGERSWQNFGVLFATLQGERAEFHTVPLSPLDALRAGREAGGDA